MTNSYVWMISNVKVSVIENLYNDSFISSKYHICDIADTYSRVMYELFVMKLYKEYMDFFAGLRLGSGQVAMDIDDPDTVPIMTKDRARGQLPRALQGLRTAQGRPAPTLAFGELS